MAWDETSCFEVESGEGYLYYDAKNVMCDRDRDYHGIPLYSPGGEYNGGCVECSEDDGCPTDPCLAGYRRHASLACVPCAPDRYNAGGMAWDTEECYEIPEGEGYVRKDPTSVQCKPDGSWWGAPIYTEQGEYNGGCNECDEDHGCPTPSPTASPTTTTTPPPTSPPTTAPPTDAELAAGAMLRGGEEDPPKDEADGGLSSKARIGIVVGGVVLIVAVTFFARASSSSDKREKKNRKFVRQQSARRAEVGALTPNPLRSSNASAASTEQAPSEPSPAPPAGDELAAT